MKGEVVKIHVLLIDVQRPAYIVAEKRKMQVVAGAEDDAVEVLSGSVLESHGLAV